MAFISKQEVQRKNEALKAINKKYGVTARFSGSNSMTLKLTITAGSIDFIENFCETGKNSFFEYDRISKQVRKDKYIQVNHYYMDEYFSGVALEYLKEAYAIMQQGHYDDSDVMIDYFNCSWYNSIHIGRWNKPYELKVKN